MKCKMNSYWTDGFSTVFHFIHHIFVSAHRAELRGAVCYLSDCSSQLRSTNSFHAEASADRAELKNSPRPTGTPLHKGNEIHLLYYSFLSRHRIHCRCMMREMFKFCQAWKITCMHGIILPKDQIPLS